MDLHGLARAPDGGLAGDQLRGGGLRHVGPALIAEPRRPVGEEPRGLGLGPHVGELGLDRLVGADRLAERLALGGVGEAVIQAGLREAGGDGPDRDPPAVERRQRLGEAASAFAEQVILGDAAAVERELVRVSGVPSHLAVGRTHGETLGARPGPGSS